MRTEFFFVAPRGLGTIEAESFGSVVCRLAQAHSVTFWVFLEMLRNWWWRTRREALPKPPQTRSFFCPVGKTLEIYVRAVGLGTGCTEIGATTLAEITRALCSIPVGLTKQHRQWCPACWREDCLREEEPYERLVWQLAPIDRCTLHRIELENTCPHCGITQRVYCRSGEPSACSSCFGSLVSAPERWRRSFKPTLGEVDCIDMVERASASNLQVQDQAFSRFYDKLAEVAATGSIKLYQSNILVDKAHARRRRKVPSFLTALRECTAAGISLTHVLEDPEDAANSVGLLEIARLSFSKGTANRISVSEYAAARSLLQVELSKPEGVSVRTTTEIERECGVAWLTIRRRFPDLAASFAEKRRRWNEFRQCNEESKLEAELGSGLLTEYLSGKIASQDRLVLELARRCEVNVNKARKALGRALDRRSATHVHWSRRVMGKDAP